jgi:hypothetical protein
VTQRIDKDNPNLALWHTLMPTDAKISVGGAEKEITKSFQRGGGFRGTAINPTYVVMRLTAAFGPVGQGWGYEVVSSEVVIGAPVLDKEQNILGHESVQVTRIKFWWKLPGLEQEEYNQLQKEGHRPTLRSIVGERCAFEQVGQTMFVSFIRADPNKGRAARFDTDEEAWKKSLTDAITKAASHLGIAADVHLGLWDDNKYTTGRADAADTEIQQQAANENAAKTKELETQTLTLIARIEAAASEDAFNNLLSEASVLRAQLNQAGMKPSVQTLRVAVATARERLDLAA